MTKIFKEKQTPSLQAESGRHTSNRTGLCVIFQCDALKIYFLNSLGTKS